MSGTKKKLTIGGTIAGLALSLSLPLLPSTTGNPSHELLAAGVGPRYSKPWRAGNPSGNSGTRAVKSYPIPDSLKFERNESAAPSGNSSEVMQELEHLHQQNGSTAPTMTGSGSNVPVQEASLRRSRQTEAAATPAPRKGNPFSRLFDRITGRGTPRPQDSSRPEDTYVEESPSDYVGENFFEPQPAAVTPPHLFPTEVPVAEAPVAEVIIPPQPQPNFLPEYDFSKPESLKPAITQGVKSVDENDPFPLPPLPGGSEPTRTAVSSTVQAATAPVLGDSLIPPLPGMAPGMAPDMAAAPEQEEDQSTGRALVETAAPVLPEPAAALAAEAFPGVSTAEEARDLTAELPVELKPSGSAMPEAAVAEAEPEPKKRGELETNLPLAPSSSFETRSQPRGAVTQQKQPQAQEEVPDTFRGWRSRESQSAYQEPNTLNIPTEARPTELPPAAMAHQEDSPADKYRLIAERGERTGFKGFCPVALKDHLELVDAHPEFRTEFEGQIYYFSSDACRELFESDPIRYVPAQGGIDLVKYLQEGTQEPGRLDFAVWYQDRLFLFSCEQTLETFRIQPERFVK